MDDHVFSVVAMIVVAGIIVLVNPGQPRTTIPIAPAAPPSFNPPRLVFERDEAGLAGCLQGADPGTARGACFDLSMDLGSTLDPLPYYKK